MDKDIKVKWLEALRSGQYRQGKDRLRNNNGTMCCLGVLCDIVDPKGWTKEYAGGWLHNSGDPGSAYINDTFASNVGLTSSEVSGLAAINDGYEPNAYREVIKYIEDKL